MKVYFNTKKDDRWPYFINEEAGCTVRFAGKPKFLLEAYIKKYWEFIGWNLYQEMLDIFYNIEKSPIVLYLNPNKINNGNKENSYKKIYTGKKGSYSINKKSKWDWNEWSSKEILNK